jgi:hypothetical protein
LGQVIPALQTLRCGQVYRYGMLLAFHVHWVFNPQEWVRRQTFFVAPLALRSGLRQRGTVCSPAYPPLRLRLRSPQGGPPSPRASGALNRADSKHHRQPGIRGNGGSPQEPDGFILFSARSRGQVLKMASMKVMWLPGRDWMRVGTIFARSCFLPGRLVKCSTLKCST